MPITVTGTPMNLSWADFKTVPDKLIDPADGELADAYTEFKFDIPDAPPQVIDGQQALASNFDIKITPSARVWTGVLKTAALLSHEEWHYHVGIITARALARQLATLRAPTIPALAALLNQAVVLHFRTRAGILQKRYDLDTRHGTQAHYQKIWKQRMAACLAKPDSREMGGFYL